MDKIRSWQNSSVCGDLFKGNALDFLKDQTTESVEIVFLDPPFNLGKKYSEENPSLDSKSEIDYERWMKELLKEARRVLVSGGALYLYHIPKWAMRFGAELEKNLSLRHWIAISMKNGFVRGKNLYPAHYSLLYFTKGKPLTFSRPKLKPDTCRHCGKYVKDYGGYKKIIDKKGVNLSDFWEDISPVRHSSKKFRDANELPHEITDRVVQISGSEDMVFLDPFAGSGTSIISAIKKGMRFKACDIVEENCDLIASRVDDFINNQVNENTYV